MKKRQYAGIGMCVVAVVLMLIAQLAATSRATEHHVIEFNRGVQISEEGMSQIQHIASRMLEVPGYNAVLVGHTGTLGGTDSNQLLSEDRAEHIRKVLEKLGIERDRVDAFGVAGTQPLAKEEGEHPRTYQKRLGRVDVTLRHEDNWGL